MSNLAQGPSHRYRVLERILRRREVACTSKECVNVKTLFRHLVPQIDVMAHNKADVRDPGHIKKVIKNYCGRCDDSSGVERETRVVLRELREAGRYFDDLPPLIKATGSGNCGECGVLEVFGGHVALRLPSVVTRADLDPRFVVPEQTMDALRELAGEVRNWCERECGESPERVARVQKALVDYIHKLRIPALVAETARRVVERATRGLLLVEERDEALERALHSPVFERAMELARGEAGIKLLLAHELRMDLRVLAVFELNVFTREVNACDEGKWKSLSIVEIKAVAEKLLALANVDNARLLKERVELLELAATLNSTSASVQTWEKVEAFEKLMAKSRKAGGQVLEVLSKIKPEEMSGGEQWMLEHLS
ncbi:hypothetical protein HY992_00805 [Candidatus Micrarchaeota archaeon]|nr:hypothetical protein [Candidatus Micrarchaeota archaeon]